MNRFLAFALRRVRWMASLPLSLWLVAFLAGCAMDRDPALVACEDDSHCPSGWWCPGTPESPAACTEGQRPADDDDAVDDDDVVDDDDASQDDDDAVDDDTADDDDDVVDDDDTVLAASISTPGGLCGVPGRSANASFIALHCTGPTASAPGVSANASYTVIVGSTAVISLPE